MQPQGFPQTLNHPMSPDYLTGNQVETLYKWHLANGLDFMPGDTLDRCWCHKLIAAAIIGKDHTAPVSQKNGIFHGVTVHKHNANWVLYGDLHKAKLKKNVAKKKAVKREKTKA